MKNLLEVGDVYVHIDAKTKNKFIKERLNEIKKHYEINHNYLYINALMFIGVFANPL